MRSLWRLHLLSQRPTLSLSLFYIEVNIKQHSFEVEGMWLTDFTAPTVRPRGQSVIDCLAHSNSLMQDDIFQTRYKVIQGALARLMEIHEALLSENESSLSSTMIQDPSHHKIVEGLFDLVSLEGIYPALSPEVGIPFEKRVRSVLKGGLETRPSSINDEIDSQMKTLLAEICDKLYKMTDDSTRVSLVLRERTLLDLIASMAELGFSPSKRDKTDDTQVSKFNLLMHRYAYRPDDIKFYSDFWEISLRALI